MIFECFNLSLFTLAVPIQVPPPAPVHVPPPAPVHIPPPAPVHVPAPTPPGPAQSSNRPPWVMDDTFAQKFDPGKTTTTSTKMQPLPTAAPPPPAYIPNPSSAPAASSPAAAPFIPGPFPPVARGVAQRAERFAASNRTPMCGFCNNIIRCEIINTHKHKAQKFIPLTQSILCDFSKMMGYLLIFDHRSGVGGLSWLHWAARGTRRSLTAITATHLWLMSALWRSRIMFTVRTVTESSSPLPVLAVALRSWE